MSPRLYLKLFLGGTQSTTVVDQNMLRLLPAEKTPHDQESVPEIIFEIFRILETKDEEVSDQNDGVNQQHDVVDQYHLPPEESEANWF